MLKVGQKVTFIVAWTGAMSGTVISATKEIPNERGYEGYDQWVRVQCDDNPMHLVVVTAHARNFKPIRTGAIA